MYNTTIKDILGIISDFLLWVNTVSFFSLLCNLLNVIPRYFALFRIQSCCFNMSMRAITFLNSNSLCMFRLIFFPVVQCNWPCDIKGSYCKCVSYCVKAVLCLCLLLLIYIYLSVSFFFILPFSDQSHMLQNWSNVLPTCYHGIVAKSK